nr:hypothetical protein [Rubrobacter tropicus]
MTSFDLWTKPSTGPLLYLSVRPALTAERSFFSPAACFLTTSASEVPASSGLPVLRAWAGTSGSRSQKILRSQEGSSQKKRLARTRRMTGAPRQGRSAIVRV